MYEKIKVWFVNYNQSSLTFPYHFHDTICFLITMHCLTGPVCLTNESYNIALRGLKLKVHILIKSTTCC